MCRLCSQIAEKVNRSTNSNTENSPISSAFIRPENGNLSDSSFRNQISRKCAKRAPLTKWKAVITLLIEHSTNWRTNREIIILNWFSNWPNVCRSERVVVDKIGSTLRATVGKLSIEFFLLSLLTGRFVESSGHDRVSILWLSFNWFWYANSDQSLSLANQF